MTAQFLMRLPLALALSAAVTVGLVYLSVPANMAFDVAMLMLD